jgi:Ca2+-binding RTX toxin-like protein
LAVNNVADLNGGSTTGIDQILIASGTTATFSGAQLTGNTIAINESAAGTTNLVINVASGATNTFANLTFAAFTGGDAFDDGADTITINGAAGAENITGTTFADSISAGAGIDTIVGAQNDTLLDGGASTDTLQVGANFTSTSDAQIANIENVTLTAAVTLNLSNQTEGFNINGSSGVDSITGGSGNDTINGQAGNDTLTGNGGADQFRLRTNSDTDTITDYTDNVDKIGFLKGGTGGVNFGTVASSGGTALAGGDFDTRNTISNINTNDDNHVDVINNSSQTTAQITGDTGGTATNTYAIVFNSTTGKGEIWFDTDWNNTANRVQVATLNNITTLAGVAAITASDIVVYDSTLGPAGVAGSPINLGLSDPAGHIGAVTVTIGGVPSGWTLSEGTDNGDGTWTLQASTLSTLSITSPVNYTGAMTFQVTESWTNADGSNGLSVVTDNVEAFAPGSPIFAWSGDDHLTGSSGDDLFVFSQPIGNDIIHNFDAAHDKIDLIGYAGFTSFADVQAHLANDGNGNAMLTLADGQSITFAGVDAGTLTADDFVFEQTPVTDNAGNMVISDGAFLPLSGTINNTGTIDLNSTGNGTLLQLIQHGITLQGGGQIILSDSSDNMISGTLADVTLTNVDNTISGSGQLGGGEMTLANDGTIVATGTHTLTIDTGMNVVVNTGTLEATGSGGLVVNSAIANSGLIWAYGGNITIHGDVTGSGTATIDGNATLEFGAASSANTTFAATAAGRLILDDSFDFGGSVSGLDGNDRVDFSDIAFAMGVAMNYTANQDGTGGTLSVSDGSHTANITLLGQYSEYGFQASDDQRAGTVVTYHPSI